MRPAEFAELLRDALRAWVEDHVPSMGAALAYYTVFSIAPMLLIAIGVAGMVFGVDAARGEIVAQLRGLIGSDGAQAIEALVKSAAKPAEGLAATLLAALLLLVGATTVFVELQSALDRIWRAPVRRGEGLWALLRSRLLSFGMVMGIGFLLTVSLVLSALVAALGRFWGAHLRGWLVVAEVLNVIVGLGLVTLMFAMIYKIVPRVRVRWRDVWTGAAFTAALFVIGKALIGLYIGRSGIASGFGAAGSLVVLLLWVYWSAQIFLLGAEFTRMVSLRRATRGLGRRGAAALPDPRAQRAGASGRPSS